MTTLIQTLEGVSLLIAGILILITLKRKGKNRLLFYLALFFMGGGVFRLGMFLIGFFGTSLESDTLARLAGSISNGCLYFGLAGYAGSQINYLEGKGLSRPLMTVFLVGAGLLTLFHLAANNLLFLGDDLAAKLGPLQIPVMIFVLGISLLFLLIIFFAWFLKSRSGGAPFLSNSTLNIGLGLMLISWMLQKVVAVEAVSTLGVLLSALPFAAIGVVILAIFLQTTSAMTPGAVYNSATKHPIPLAIVRVIREEDKKLLESRVSSQEGRYGILVEPGRYTLDVNAAGFSFPGSAAGGYKGEVLDIKRPKLVGFDIFLDPV